MKTQSNFIDRQFARVGRIFPSPTQSNNGSTLNNELVQNLSRTE
ncbi:hypothetical protein WNY78_07585 [Psychroserpens sp. AS72]